MDLLLIAAVLGWLLLVCTVVIGAKQRHEIEHSLRQLRLLGTRLEAVENQRDEANGALSVAAGHNRKLLHQREELLVSFDNENIRHTACLMAAEGNEEALALKRGDSAWSPAVEAVQMIRQQREEMLADENKRRTRAKKSR